MNHITTPDTSKRLKAAGFPQPQYKRGQFWYDADGIEFLVFGFNGETISGTYLQRGGYFGGGKVDKGDCFAPTAADILKELGFEFNLWYSIQTEKYMLQKDVGHLMDAPEIVSSHENSAEAAAKAYLSIYEKKPKQ